MPEPIAPVVPAAKPVAPVAAAPKPGEAAPAAAAAPVEQTYKLEHDGKTYDLTAKQILALKGKAEQFDTTAKQKAELEKALSTLMTRIDEDPLSLFEARGKDAKKLVAERFKKMIEEDQLSPEAKELAQLRANEAARKAKDDESAKTAAEAKRQEEKKILYTQILRDIDKALTDNALPKDHYTVDRMLRIMASGKRVKGQAFTAAEAATIVQKEEMRHVGFIAKQLPSERLKEIFGADIIKKLNSAEVAKLKEADKETIKENKAAAKDAKKDDVSAEERKRARNMTAGV